MLPMYWAMIPEIEGEERNQEIQQNNIQRRLMRADSDPFTLSDNKFKDTFRLNKEMVRYLMVTLGPHMTTSSHPSAIEPSLRLFAALSFYATGTYQRDVGNSFLLSMSQSSVSNCITEISHLIVEHMAEDWIKFPQNQEEKLAIKNKFMEKTHFPGVIGAVDCTHVAIVAPSVEEHNYLNRKQFHSKNVQIVCDWDLRILNINARFAGATHDAYIWRHSVVKEELQACYIAGDRTSWLLGDSGYPQQPWLMTPIVNAAPGSPEERYTECHCRARACVERCNGVFKCRFRCLLKERVLRYRPEKVAEIVTACAVLHNICVAARLDEPLEPLLEEDLPHDQPNAVLQQEVHVNEGMEARRTLIQNYFL